jgi:hypothetical protein
MHYISLPLDEDSSDASSVRCINSINFTQKLLHIATRNHL